MWFKRGCRHDWAPWGELEFVGAEYQYVVGQLCYKQQRRCLACNEIQVKQVTIRGTGEEAEAREEERFGDPLTRS